MTATRAPGVPVIDDGFLVSSNPATGSKVGRFPVTSPDDVRAAVDLARDASAWWGGLGFAARRERLRRWSGLLTSRIQQVAEEINREGGKPVAEAIVELFAAVDHIAWAGKNAS